MDLKATYNKIAEDWQNDHTTDDWWVSGVDKFISFLEKGDKVLDIWLWYRQWLKIFGRQGTQSHRN